jgi:pilus assembly protein CpaB
MQKAQLLSIGVALLSGGGAFVMVNEMTPTPGPLEAIAPKIELDKVLIAKRDLPYGSEIGDADTLWIDWPKQAVPEGVLSGRLAPTAKEDVKSAYVHVPIAKGEPIRMERLSRGESAGAMATMLASGKRAVAVDVTLNNTAGGFILPNDRVDVMRTFRDPDATRELGRDVYATEVVLPNMRVLAMGQTIEKKNNEPVVTGSTATLEVDPQQAETLIIAQKSGQLTLVLRSIRDALPKAGVPEPAQKASKDDTITIVKYGIPTNLIAR